MEFRLLGPLEVWDDGRPLSLGGTKQRALLALLLLRANEVVSRDVLIDELWGDRPPASAAHSVEAYVSRLRKTLHADRAGEPILVTRPPGYMLRAELRGRRSPPVRATARGGAACACDARAGARAREADRGAVAVARRAARRPRVRAVRAGGGRTPGGAAARRARGADRGRARLGRSAGSSRSSRLSSPSTRSANGCAAS